MLKNILHNVLSQKSIGWSFGKISQGLGAKKTGYRFFNLAGITPEIVTVNLPGALFEKTSIVMKSGFGKDQVAREVATHGWQAFEQPLPDYFSRIISHDFTVFDIGGNSGYYTLLTASRCSDINIHVFEPEPNACAFLRKNLELNALNGPRINVVELALSDQSGLAEFYYPIDDHGLLETSGSLNSNFRESHSKTIQVPVMTMDQYCADNQIRKIDIIKLDVEGHEHAVLAGAIAVMRDMRPIIFIEILEKADTDTISSIAEQLGYKFIWLDYDGIRHMSHAVANPSNMNQALVPKEKVSIIEDTCKSLGKKISR
jgi:FkbM family methyltransferase